MRSAITMGASMLALVLAACAPPAPSHQPAAAVVDDFGDTVRAGPALRIVSLNPVTTEFLFAAGAASRVVGRTHWDHYPTAADTVPDLGNGIDPNVEAVLGAKPDLVILYASESNRRAAQAFRQAGVRTLTIRTDLSRDLTRLADAFARVTGDTAGRTAADSVARSVAAVRALPRTARPPRVLWRMGDPPLYVAGRGSFMGELIEVAGAENLFGDMAAPSPQVSLEEVVKRNPDFILTGPEGLAKMRASAAWQAVPAVRRGKVLVVDTTLVGRPGIRLGEAAHHVRRLIFPDSVR
jgi:ABC-type Fe3+-hydroxamate transport system substrate-binding protein